MPRLRSAPTTQPAAKSKAGTRQALAEKTNTARAKPPVYEDDGYTEDLVKDAKPKRGRPKKTKQPSDELVMAGGLGSMEDRQSQPTGEAQPTTDELARSDTIQMTTDELAKTDVVPPPTVKPQRRPPRPKKKVVQSEAQSKVLEGLKQRMEATARGQRAEQAAVMGPSEMSAPSSDSIVVKLPEAKPSTSVAPERSELSLSPSPPPPGKLSVVKAKRTSIAQPGSVLKAQGTPGMENSIFALKNFKRRPRQLSMLEMVQQRTASARPSMTNTTVEATAVEDSGAFDLDLETDEEQDFAPEAEGTPLYTSRTKRKSSARVNRPSSAERASLLFKEQTFSKKRKSNDANETSSSLSRSHAKRRKSALDDENEATALPSQTVTGSTAMTSSARGVTPRVSTTSDVPVQRSPLPSSTPPTEPSSSHHKIADQIDEFAIPSTEREDEQLIVEDDLSDEDAVPNSTMAEPLSSSPLRAALQPVDDLADPLTQLSPVAAKPKSKKKVQPISTAVLQSLLPKKRRAWKPRHRKSEYDLESDSDEDRPLDASHLKDDEDELGGGLRRAKKQVKASKATGAKRGRPSKLAKKAQQTSTAAKKTQKTYGRATTSDKENYEYESAAEDETEESLPEITVAESGATKSKEIEEAKRRFAEVDEWDMEFESVGAEDHRSSSQDWR